MQPSDPSLAVERADTEASFGSDVTQTLEQMLEAEIMGTSVYPDLPEPKPFEEWLAELQHMDAGSTALSADRPTSDLDVAVGNPHNPQALGATDGTEAGRADIVVPLAAIRPGGGAAGLRSATSPPAIGPNSNQAEHLRRRRRGPRLSWLYVWAAGLFALSCALFAYWGASDRDALAPPYAKVGNVDGAGATSVVHRDISRASMVEEYSTDATSTKLVSVAPSTVAGSSDVIGKPVFYPARKVRLYRVDGAGNILGYVGTE